MNGGKIEIEVVSDSRDFWRSSFDIYFSANNFFIYFMAFAVYGMFIAFLWLGGDTDIFNFGDIFLSSVVFVVLFGLINSYLSVSMAKRLNFGKYKFTFSNEKVEIITKSFTSFLDWDWFVQIRETKNYFIFFLKSGQRTLMPKRCFSGYEQLAEFKALIGSKLGERVYLRKSKENLGLK